MIEIILIVSALCGIGIPFIIWGITPWLILWIPLFGIGIYAVLLALYFIVLIIMGLFFDSRKEFYEPNDFIYAVLRDLGHTLNRLSRIKIHVEGRELIPKDQKYLLISNHISNYDPIVNVDVFKDKNVVYISKESNFHIPIAGRLAKGSGFLAIDREDVRKAMGTINRAAEYIKADKASVCIYPEGTRNKTDEKLLEFRNGALKIATKAKCPLVIMTIRGTRDVVKNFPFKRTHVYVKVGEVIPADKVASMKTNELSDEARKIMLEFLNEDIK